MSAVNAVIVIDEAYEAKCGFVVNTVPDVDGNVIKVV